MPIVSVWRPLEQVKALLKSYSEGEGEHFVSVALQIAAHPARTGKEKLAQELRDLVDEIKRKQATGKVGGAVPIARPQGELAGLLAVSCFRRVWPALFVLYGVATT